MSSKKYSFIHIFERINFFRLEMNLTQSEFAAKTGITQGFYSDMKIGRGGISGKLLVGMADAFPNLDLNWIITGKGNMYQSINMNTVHEEHAPYHTPALAKLIELAGSCSIKEQEVLLELINQALKLTTLKENQ